MTEKVPIPNKAIPEPAVGMVGHQKVYGVNNMIYRQISNISRTKFQNLNVTRLVLQWSVPNPLKPCVKSRMKM